MKQYSTDPIYYVYKLVRPDLPDPFHVWESQPFYIGKGCNNRIKHHRRKAKRAYNNYKGSDPLFLEIHDLWDRGLDFKEIKIQEQIPSELVFEIENKFIRKYGRKNNGTGCLVNKSGGGEGGNKKTREEFLEDLKDRYGEIIYKILLDYPNNPIITQADIAKAMNISREAVRVLLDKIHGQNASNLQSNMIEINKQKCYIGGIKGIVGEKLRKEKIKYKKKIGTIWKCENGKTFAVHKLVLHKQSGLYIVDFAVKADYIIVHKNDNIYIIPSTNNDSKRIYLHYPEDFKHFKDFSCLKDIVSLENKLPEKQEKQEKQEEPIEKEIPYGYCHCGCGKKTNIIKANNKKGGQIKGEPNKYVFGHNNNKLSDDDIKSIILKYNNNNISMCALAKDYKVTPATIKYHLKNNNVKLKPHRGMKKGSSYSCKEKEFICSICDKIFIKKRRPKEMICSDCRKKEKEVDIELTCHLFY